MRYLILFLFVFLFFHSGVAQQRTYLLQPREDILEIEKKWKGKRLDSLGIILELQQIINELQASAFLEASIDSLEFTDSIATFSIYKGPEYEFGKLDVDEEFEDILEEAGYRQRNINGRRLDVSFIGQMFDQIIKVLENNGYPFASIALRDYEIYDSALSGKLVISKGRMITMDTFNLYGLDHVSKTYLYNYLQINPGDVYNASEILKVKSRINNLNFLELTADPTVRFLGNKAILNLKLRERNASRFDFIIGIQPGSGQEQRYTITGDVNFEIQNKLKQGEQFSIKFERLKQETQRLDMNFKYPFLLNLPFGFDSEFNLFRNENLHRDLNFSFGVLYQLKANNYLKAFYNVQTSRLIEIDTLAILNSGRLPNRLDVATNNFGLETQYQDLDYLFNPRKGYRVILRGTAGQKNIIPSNAILTIESERVDFNLSYDTIDLSTYQFKLNVNAELFIPVGQRSTIRTALRAEKIFSESRIYENEYFRIGGNRLLRGFDEESISAEFYSVATLEYRLLLSRNSFLSAFLDYGVRQNRYDNAFEWDQPYGAGAGFSLETAAGIFGVNVAVGSQKGNPLDLRNAKTHMGFLGLF